MNTTLLKRFDTLETQRKKLLGLIAACSNEELNAHPEGKWSIAQILSHLIASEHLSIKYLNKKILGIKEAPDTGVMEELKIIILIISQRLPLKFRAPKVLAENTTVYQTKEELGEAWEKTRGELKEVLTRFNEDQLKRKVYKHPVAGMLNIKQAIQVLQEHINHHTPQIKNLLQRK